MSRILTLAILSDIHYASEAEQIRGEEYELQGISSPAVRLLVRTYRRVVWLRHPFRQGHLLEEFLKRAETADYVIANGDYSCDTRFVGVSDDAAFQSARECLEKLRVRFNGRFYATFGDHELGKLSLCGGQGGMRWASYLRARDELGLVPFWRIDLGRYVLFGLASSLVALPCFEPDTLAEERSDWGRLREEHLAEIRSAFANLPADRRVLLFCHDPTALPFLWQEEAVRSRLSQIEQTIIGHLHSNLIFWKSRKLAGMPRIQFLGNSIRRMTAALSEARLWKPFRVRLCPSLAGIELLKDGGFYTAEVDPEANRPMAFELHRLPR